MTSSNTDGLGNPLQPTPPLSGSQRNKSEQEQRLEFLKQQKESARKEKERALWRAASQMPESKEDKAQPITNAQKAQPASPKPVSGLFAKLKLGRFLE